METDHPAVTAYGEHVLITLEGHDYLRRDASWYDATSRIRVPVIENSRLEAKLRAEPQLFEVVVAEVRRQIIERHRMRLEVLGITYRGVAAWAELRHYVSHCWDCKDTVDSEINLQCLKCWWLVCQQCAACGCGCPPWAHMYRP